MWFKAAQKRAGKTSYDLGDAIGRDRSVISRIVNGAQAPTLDQARILARELGVPLPEFIERAGMGDSNVAKEVSPGFTDGDAAIYVPPTVSQQRERAIATVMGQRPGVDVWRVKNRSMVLAGLLEGDFILVDTHAADKVRSGDIVIAQLYNPHGATTVLRRYEPPVLVAASPDPADAKVHVVDGINVVIRGKVVSSWRF